MGTVGGALRFVMGMDGELPYAAFTQFRAAVFFPWDSELATFGELYCLGIPLFVPSAEYVAYYATLSLVSGNVWQGLRADWLTALPGLPRRNATLFPVPMALRADGSAPGFNLHESGAQPLERLQDLKLSAQKCGSSHEFHAIHRNGVLHGRAFHWK